MPLSTDVPDQPSSADSLPPVEPPNAGFIIQLFVIPGIIVAIIVVVWGLFNWLAQMGNDPASYVEALQRNNGARWQSAMNLADALRDSRNVTLKHNSAVAKKLADILEAELAAGHTDENSIELRVYLCHALGEFQVADGIDALIKAAKTGQTTEEKYAALKALAVFASANRLEPSVYDQILPVVLEASQDSESLLRSTAAFALGSLPGEQPTARLERMLTDAEANVRFNAATMLATEGKTSSIGVLVEMLDPKSTAGVHSEEDPTARDYKRSTILVNALRATGKLAEANPSADLAALRAAVAGLSAGEAPKNIQIEAAQVLKILDRRGADQAK